MKKINICAVLGCTAALLLGTLLYACKTDEPEGSVTDTTYTDEQAMTHITVNSIEELREIDGISYSSVSTLGYYAPGDGGAYTYYADRAMKNLSDNGGTVIIGNDGTCWKAVYNGALPLSLFGAKGDGKTDDTKAIKAWLKELGEGESGYAAAGSYLFTEPLVFPTADSISIRGDGSQQTCFIYTGSDTACDLITVGADKKQLHGWTLERFNVESKTDMSAGCALHLINLKHTVKLRDVSVSRVDDKNGNMLWNGVFFDRCSLADYTGFEINVKNEGIMIAGTSDDDSSADISIDKGTITFSRIGIHCGGGFGGLYIGQVLIYGCTDVGYLQDNSIAARGNREIIISDTCVLDACNSYCAKIDDALSYQCTLQFNAFISGAGWIAPATPGDGLYIKSLPTGRISVGSNHIKHCIGNGITYSDPSAYLTIAPTVYLVGNGGYALRAESASYNVKNEAVMLYNAK